jgi:hypothetical protein
MKDEAASNEKEFEGKKKVPTTDTDKAKSDITSPNMRPGFTKVLGGMPAMKDVKEVDKINQPSGRKRAPGSVRV